MFQEREEEKLRKKKAGEGKKVTIIEDKKEESAAKKEVNDKVKEQKMNKALQRLKKKREKDKEKEKEAAAEGEAIKRDNSNVIFKSIKIKNMADLLEGQINKTSQDEGDKNENTEKEIKYEENNIDNALNMIQEGNVVVKRKKTVKKFEDNNI